MGKWNYRFKKAIGLCISYVSKTRYLDYIGLHHGNDIRIYGSIKGMFGSEPWLITLGNNVHITSEVKFITHDGGTLLFRKNIPDLEITSPIVIGNNVYIGTRSMILPGVNIGNNCIIAAGAVVSKNIPDNSVAAGVPARVIKSADEYLEKIKIESIHLGQYKYEDKDRRMKKYFNYKK